MRRPKLPWKACGAPARIVVITEPGKDAFFCKRHGPEDVIRKMGLLFRKARAGEKCGQSQNWDGATLETIRTLHESGDPDAAFEHFKQAMKGKS